MRIRNRTKASISLHESVLVPQSILRPPAGEGPSMGLLAMVTISILLTGYLFFAGTPLRPGWHRPRMLKHGGRNGTGRLPPEPLTARVPQKSAPEMREISCARSAA